MPEHRRTCSRSRRARVASTTRAPRRSRSATHCSATSELSVGRPSPTPGGCRTRPTVRPSRRGSGTGSPVITDQRSATSSTVRPIGPTVSSVGTSGKTPSIGILPHADLSPTVSQHAEGSRIEQPVSVPMPKSQRPGRRSRRRYRRSSHPSSAPGARGFCTVPYQGFWPITLHANSGRFALPTTTAPASSTRSTTARVPLGTWSP